MKKLINVLLKATLILFPSALVLAAPGEATLKVEHMDCVTCPVVVRAALYDLDGVENVRVSLAEKTVKVRFDDQHLTEDMLAEAVTNAGFPAEVSQ